ncbi:MAG: hypothetical protein GTN70_09370, partial [Deltaproteobacteria bacterium]|nr:hypothetical protein [Deltaproteobacteria bacterium]
MCKQSHSQAEERDRAGTCCVGDTSCDGSLKRRPTILLVDDDKDIVEMLRDQIEHHGNTSVEIFTALGAEHALAILRQREIDLMVCDHYL